MVTQPRLPNLRTALAQSVVLLVVLDGVGVAAQDHDAPVVIVAPATTILVRLPVAVAPALPRERQEAFLRTAAIRQVRSVKTGVTGTQRVALETAGRLHDASVQTIDQLKARFETSTGVEFHFRDYWGYNVAAYRLGVLLGLDNIPVSVPRHFRSRQAAFTWWIDNVLMDERTRVERQVEPPDPATWNAQVYIMRVFDELVANHDRNRTNMLIDCDWTLWLIDHSRAFRLARQLRAPAVLRRCERTLLAQMRTLTRATVDRELGDYLTPMERDALMARRDALVAHFEALGAGALYDGTGVRR